MYKVEVIKTDDSNKMISKDILYWHEYDSVKEYVDNIKKELWVNGFVFIEEVPDWALVQIRISDFYVNNELAKWNDFIAVWNILEQEYVNNAIDDYINKDL